MVVLTFYCTHAFWDVWSISFFFFAYRAVAACPSKLLLLLRARYEWEKHGFGDLLMMALPHHMDTIHVHNADTIVMNNTYQTIKVICGFAKFSEQVGASPAQHCLKSRVSCPWSFLFNCKSARPWSSQLTV